MKSYLRVMALNAASLGMFAGLVSASPVTLQNATATFSQGPPCSGSWDVSQAIDGITSGNNGWAIAQSDCLTTNAETAWFETAANQGSAIGTMFTFTMRQNLGNYHTLGDFDLSYTTSARVGGFNNTATWTALPLLTATATNGAILSIIGTNEVEASGPNPLTSVYTITAQTFVTGITGLRIETLLDPAYPTNGPGRQPTNGNFVLTEFEVDAANAQQVVPEPATLGLILSGLGALARARRRRQSLEADQR